MDMGYQMTAPRREPTVSIETEHSDESWASAPDRPPFFRAARFALALALLAFAASSCVTDASAAGLVDDFQVTISAKKVKRGKRQFAYVKSVKITSATLSKVTPSVKCKSRKCKRERGSRIKAISRNKSVRYSNVRWLVPRGKSIIVATNRRGYIGRYKELRLKPQSYTQFVVVRSGCTSKDFRRTACPPPPPAARRCARRLAHQSGSTGAGAAATTLSTGDFDGDGRDDVGLLYNYGNASTGLFRFFVTSNLTMTGYKDWQTPDGQIDWNAQRVSAGDFNGDCYTEMAALGDLGGGNTAVAISGRSTVGPFGPFSQVWRSNGGFPWSSIKTVAGDFNGDQFDDLALFVGIGGGVGLYVMPGSVSGLGAPQSVWAGSGWSTESLIAVSTNSDGDSADDVAVFYDRGAGQGVNLWNFRGGSSWLSEPQVGWISDPSWEFGKIRALGGDFNGDGFGDVGMFYAPETNRATVLQMTGSLAGLSPPTLSWDSGAGNWDINAIKIASGDFDGDGRSDLTAAYNYGPGSMRFWTFAGGSAPPVVSWFTASGWEWGRIQ